MSQGAHRAVEMTLSIVEPRPDLEDIENSLIALRRELADHRDVVATRFVSQVPVPAGSKALDGLIAALSVTVLRPAVLAVVMEAVTSWTTRRNRVIRVEIDGDSLELTNATGAQQQQLLDAWLSRRGVSR